MHPALALFLKVTVAVTLLIVALFIVAFLLKIVVVAAIVAAVAVGGFLVFNFFRRRSSLPVIR
jgi:hypothetical protein